MITDSELDRPGRATSPAFAFATKRDFDGGLLQRWSFVQTRADALAYLRLRREWPMQARVAFGVICLAGGAVSGLWGRGLFPFLMTESVLVLALFAGRDLWRRITSARLVPVPRPAVLEEWIDCIAGTAIEGGEDEYMSPELIGDVTLTKTHLFIRSHATALVIPRTALGAEAEAIAADIRSLARGPYYFDPPLDEAAATD